MRLHRELAEYIARVAIAEPYRQIRVQTTREYSSWLGKRGIDLSWEAIHELWRQGVLHPIAVFEPAVRERLDARFSEIELGYPERTFIDTGADRRYLPSYADASRRGGGLGDSLLWHPSQLYIFEWLMRVIDLGIAREAALRPSAGYLRIARRSLDRVGDAVTAFANDERQEQFANILALLLAAEPIVHTMINPSVVSNPFAGESSKGYLEWQRAYDADGIMDKVDLSLADVESWHRDIATSAQLIDPNERWRVLIRHADHANRERLKGSALRADTLYDTAEVLRRYLEIFHGRTLVEEDDAMHGPMGAAVKQNLYGARRIADFDRRVFRRVVRDFDLDPQCRTTWFYEGYSEAGFISRYADRLVISLERSGVELMNLGGVGGLASDRLLALLERFQREEVFPYVTVDSDTPDAERLLRRYRDQGLMPAGYKIWNGDFEGHNFSVEELAQVASQIALGEGIDRPILTDEIASRIAAGAKAGNVVEALLGAAGVRHGKGFKWGERLADWAADNACPREKQDDQGHRPVVGRLLFLLRGQSSQYKGTVEHYQVDDQGDVIPRVEPAEAIAAEG